MDLESAKKMHEAALKNNVFFMVAHVIRFWPEYIFLKKVLAEKTYGNLKNAVFNRISPRPSWSWNDWMMDMNKSGRAAVDLHIQQNIAPVVSTPQSSLQSLEIVLKGLESAGMKQKIPV